jgi:hypothetical protein
VTIDLANATDFAQAAAVFLVWTVFVWVLSSRNIRAVWNRVVDLEGELRVADAAECGRRSVHRVAGRVALPKSTVEPDPQVFDHHVRQPAGHVYDHASRALGVDTGTYHVVTGAELMPAVAAYGLAHEYPGYGRPPTIQPESPGDPERLQPLPTLDTDRPVEVDEDEYSRAFAAVRALGAGWWRGLKSCVGKVRAKVARDRSPAIGGAQ